MRKRTRRAQLGTPEGEYETYVSSPLYAELAALKKKSMLWDEVIELIAEDVLKGTSIAILNYEPSVALSEAALRVVAAEPIMNRVSLAHALRRAMERCVGENMARLVILEKPDVRERLEEGQEHPRPHHFAHGD